MKQIINRDKSGKHIPDISKVQLPYHLEAAVFKILNPKLQMDFKEVNAQ